MQDPISVGQLGKSFSLSHPLPAVADEDRATITIDFGW